MANSLDGRLELSIGKWISGYDAMFGTGAIRRTEVEKKEEIRCVREGRLAGERFDYLYEHWLNCQSEKCSECKVWEKVCELLLEFWAS